MQIQFGSDGELNFDRDLALCYFLCLVIFMQVTGGNRWSISLTI